MQRKNAPLIRKIRRCLFIHWALVPLKIWGDLSAINNPECQVSREWFDGRIPKMKADGVEKDSSSKLGTSQNSYREIPGQSNEEDSMLSLTRAWVKPYKPRMV